MTSSQDIHEHHERLVRELAAAVVDNRGSIVGLQRLWPEKSAKALTERERMRLFSLKLWPMAAQFISGQAGWQAGPLFDMFTDLLESDFAAAIRPLIERLVDGQRGPELLEAIDWFANAGLLCHLMVFPFHSDNDGEGDGVVEALQQKYDPSEGELPEICRGVLEIRHRVCRPQVQVVWLKKLQAYSQRELNRFAPEPSLQHSRERRTP